tara:strand:+ start:52 stop:426 length:375 start_codon:yes stop_codon:yes gene_type:complete
MKLNSLSIGAILGAIAIIFGAFGAHFLESNMSSYSTNLYKTAVNYQFLHALLLVFVSTMDKIMPNKRFLSFSKYFLVSGILIFCSSLYAIALFGSNTIGFMAPIGAIFLVIGWLLLAVAGFLRN